MKKEFTDLAGHDGLSLRSKLGRPDQPDRPARREGEADITAHRQLEIIAEGDATFKRVFGSAESVVWIDVPDHPNVGDSAILLGELAWCYRNQLNVRGCFSLETYNRHRVARLMDRNTVIAIHGGGNLGGLYPHHDRMRERIFADFSGSSLIQAPQSIHLVDSSMRNHVLAEFSGRESAQVLVRDHESKRAALKYLTESQVSLAPDSVHQLGPLTWARPTQQTVYLCRTDKERAGEVNIVDAEDWLVEPVDPLIYRLPKALARRNEKFSGLVNHSVDIWRARASARLIRGIRQLSRGEVVVTDRLHAMLLGMQLGRRIVAVDNENGKLSKYYGTWFAGSDELVTWADSFGEAVDISSRM